MESRLKKSLKSSAREDRASEEASRSAPEDKFISKQDRRKMWSDEEWTQSALPKLPAMDGWHLCWLSTTNSYDSIDKRIRLGYIPVKPEEIPGYENYRVKAGEYVGYIACNEMLLFKIPMDVYQDYMLEMHHDRPRDEADKVRVQVENLQGQRDSNGRSLVNVEGEGLGNLDQQPSKVPVFAG